MITRNLQVVRCTCALPGSGIAGFDTATNAAGQTRITRYHYCPQHRPGGRLLTTTTED